MPDPSLINYSILNKITQQVILFAHYQVFTQTAFCDKKMSVLIALSSNDMSRTSQDANFSPENKSGNPVITQKPLLMKKHEMNTKRSQCKPLTGVHLNTTVSIMAPRHCTIFDVISSSTLSSRCLFGSCFPTFLIFS